MEVSELCVFFYSFAGSVEFLSLLMEPAFGLSFRFAYALMVFSPFYFLGPRVNILI